MAKTKVVILGSGNIGMDLMYKVLKSNYLEMGLLSGLNSDSPRLQMARDLGIPTSEKGIAALVENVSAGHIVFDATTARAHVEHAKIIRALGKIAIDLTPASVGTKVAPAINLEANLDKDNINMVSCGGQAVLPIVYAVNQVAGVDYAEILTANSSKSVGPGTRNNLNEYILTTSRAMVEIGGAKRAKAMTVLNPAEPPLRMNNTIYLLIETLNPDLEKKITASLDNMVKKIQAYVAGYRFLAPPQYDYQSKVVTVLNEVEGAGDYLPSYAGNLDIINQAAVAVAERLARV
jgi:acetaldehyde dehydrogenase